jgi:drug/metabolite transporter (DMT)-like permease
VSPEYAPEYATLRKLIKPRFKMSKSAWQNFYPYFLVLVSSLVWGLTFSLARIATSENAHPLGLSFWQAFGGGVTLLFVCGYRGVLPKLGYSSIRRYLVIAFTGTAIPATLFFYAASKVPAGILAITVTVVPLLTYGVSLLLGIDTYARKRFIGILLGFVAILFLVIPEASLPDPSMTPWLLLALLSSVFYTVENLYVDAWVPDDTDMTALLTGGLFMAALVLVPIQMVQDTWVPLHYPFTKIEWSILAIAVAGSLAYALFFLVVKLAGAVFASLTAYVVTITGVLWGIIIFDETHSLWVWSAFLLLFVGMILVTPRNRSANV